MFLYENLSIYIYICPPVSVSCNFGTLRAPCSCSVRVPCPCSSLLQVTTTSSLFNMILDMKFNHATCTIVKKSHLMFMYYNWGRFIYSN